MRYISTGLLSLLLSVSSASTSADTNVIGSPNERDRLILQADYNLTKQKPEEAYTSLKSFEQKYANDAMFNYLLGLSAAETGRFREATWILERSIALESNNAHARLVMAQSLFELEEYAKSQAHFEYLLQLDPPDDSRRIISTYLQKIALIQIRPSKEEIRLQANFFGGLGYDSNVNTAPDDRTITPGDEIRTLLITLGSTDGSFEVESAKGSLYVTGGANGRALYELSRNTQAWGSIQGSTKQLASNTEYSTIDIDASMGFQWSKENHRVATEVSLNNEWQDGSQSKRFIGLTTSYQNLISDNMLLGGYGILENQDYPNNSSSDGKLFVLGASGSYIFNNGGPLATVNLFAGIDQAGSGRADGDNTLLGFNVAGTIFRENNHRITTKLTYITNSFDKENAIFNKKRSDNQLITSVDYGWPVNDKLQLSSGLSYSTVTSNIDLYDSKKATLYVKFNYRYR